jgi:hypothetical protein
MVCDGVVLGFGFDAIGLTWRGVNHHRLPVDAIVIDELCVLRWMVSMDGGVEEGGDRREGERQ